MAEDTRAAGPRRGASGPTLLYGGLVLVAGAAGPELREVEVLFDEQRVALVGRAVTVLPGTRVIDAQGCLIAALVSGAPVASALPALESLPLGDGVAAGSSGLAGALVPVRAGQPADLVVLALARPPATPDPATAVAGAVVRQVFRAVDEPS